MVCVPVAVPIVHLILHLTSAPDYTGHSQPLPHHLGHNDAVADEGCHHPHGQSAEHQSTDPAKQGQDDSPRF